MSTPPSIAGSRRPLAIPSRRRGRIAGVALALGILAAPPAGVAADATAEPEAPELNGFRLAPASVPVDRIRRGGPPRDGIAALDAPPHVPAAESPWLAEEMVIGVTAGGASRAYPLSILVWHELVDDTLGGRPILVSFCPLCGSGLVFDRRVAGDTLRFGVSGLLYESNLLMFDRESDSLWSQLAGRAVTGPRHGQRLALVPSRIERWGRWKAQHPDTTVLSRETGHEIDYDRSPYDEYALSARLYSPVSHGDPRYHPKMPVLGLRFPDGRTRAYPAVEVREAGGSVVEEVEGRRVRVFYDTDALVFRAEVPDDVEVVESYWFAWVAFHPDTEVFAVPRPEEDDSEAPTPPRGPGAAS